MNDVVNNSQLSYTFLDGYGCVFLSPNLAVSSNLFSAARPIISNLVDHLRVKRTKLQRNTFAYHPRKITLNVQYECNAQSNRRCIRYRMRTTKSTIAQRLTQVAIIVSPSAQTNSKTFAQRKYNRSHKSSFLIVYWVHRPFAWKLSLSSTRTNRWYSMLNHIALIILVKSICR